MPLLFLNDFQNIQMLFKISDRHLEAAHEENALITQTNFVVSSTQQSIEAQ